MYVKIFAGIMHSSIAKNTALRRFFMDMLVLCDREGEVIMTKEAIAHAMRVPIEEVEWGIAELLKPDTDSKNTDEQGRRIIPIDGLGYGWKIVNYPFYRDLKDADDMRAKTRERVRRCREKERNARNAAVTPSNTCTPSYSSSDTSSEEEKKPRKRGQHEPFIPPTVEDVAKECAEKGYTFSPVKFHAFYASKGWMVGKNTMKDWKHAARGWAVDKPAGSAAPDLSKYKPMRRSDAD